MKTIKNYLYRLGFKAQAAGGLAIAAFVNVLFLSTAHAQAPGIEITDVKDVNVKVLCPIFTELFYILMGVSVLMILYGAYNYMRAEDDPEKVKLATKTITYAAVGIAVALLAKAAPMVIGSIFGVGYLSACR